MMQADIFSCPTLVVHGEGAARSVGVHAKDLSRDHALIVVDPGVKETDSLHVVEESLSCAGVSSEIFDRVKPEPSSAAVDEAASAVAEDVGVLIALGGGSAMDLAKGMRIVAECGGSIRDYRGADKLPGSFRIALICIPSTSGTGSEVSWGGVYSDENQGMKFPVAGRSNAPDIALVDPLVTRSMPQHVTAATGCDTLVHAVESYLSNFATPLTEALSLQAVELAAHSLQQAYADGSDIAARDKMARACTLAAMAFNTSRLGMAHGICLPLAAKFRLPHGLAVGVMLPYVMEFNRDFCGPKFFNVAHELGLDVRGTTCEEAARKSIESIRRLYEFMNIPLRLREIGVTPDAFDEIAELAMNTHQAPANPRPIRSKEELLELLDLAY